MSAFATAAVFVAEPAQLFFETLTTAGIEKKIGEHFICVLNDSYCAYFSYGAVCGYADNVVAADALMSLGLHHTQPHRRLAVAGTAVVMRRDNKPFTDADIRCVRKSFALAKCFECAAPGCFNGTELSDVYCRRALCDKLICSLCVKTGEHNCKKHAAEDV